MKFAGGVAQELGLKESMIAIKQAALLHDIGKLVIPEKILFKREILCKDEYEIIKSHPVWGVDYLEEKGFPKFITMDIKHHHERWDGNGYPDGLKEREIPIGSRIISVIDSFDAMTNNRPYRKALAYKDAIKELKRSAGTQFDPDIVKVFLTLLKEKEEAKVV